MEKPEVAFAGSHTRRLQPGGSLSPSLLPSSIPRIGMQTEEEEEKEELDEMEEGEREEEEEEGTLSEDQEKGEGRRREVRNWNRGSGIRPKNKSSCFFFQFWVILNKVGS